MLYISIIYKYYTISILKREPLTGRENKLTAVLVLVVIIIVDVAVQLSYLLFYKTVTNKIIYTKLCSNVSYFLENPQ